MDKQTCANNTACGVPNPVNLHGEKFTEYSLLPVALVEFLIAIILFILGIVITQWLDCKAR